MKNFLNVFFRLVKLSLPNYGDFELLFSQIQQFITVCSKEQIQFAGEKCKFLVNVQCTFFLNINFNFKVKIFVISIFLVAHICHFITQCLVDLKQVCMFNL